MAELEFKDYGLSHIKDLLLYDEISYSIKADISRLKTHRVKGHPDVLPGGRVLSRLLKEKGVQGMEG